MTLLDRLAALLIAEEGLRLEPYKDTEGYLTIGVGRLIDPARGGGISRDEALYMLNNDMGRVIHELTAKLPWFAELDETRQIVMAAMAFQLGITGVLNFKRMITAAQARQWDLAAQEMLESRWADQTPDRARRMAEAMKTGTLHG